MKSLRPCLLSLAVLLLIPGAVAGAADKVDQPGPDLTLEDIIFDAKYLKQLLGANTLVAPEADSGEIPTAAITSAGLQEKSKIYTLPEEAVKPVLKTSFPPTYPQSVRLREETLQARFLLFVGTDGHVKCLYCYDTNDRIFALAAADTVIKWRYKPGKIGQTIVPVLVPLTMKLTESDATRSTFGGPTFKMPEPPVRNPPPTPSGPGPR